MANTHKGYMNIGKQELLNYTFDRMARCVYFTFSTNKVHKTVEHVPDTINVDFDKEGKLVGIEFMGVKGFKFIDSQIFVEISNIYNTPVVKRVPKILEKELVA